MTQLNPAHALMLVGLLSLVACADPPRYGEPDGSHGETLELAALWGPVADAGETPLHLVRGIAAAPGGVIYVSDGGNARIVKLGAGGAVLGTFGQAGSGPGEYTSLSSLAYGEGRLLALDGRARRITSYDSTGRILGTVALRERLSRLALHNGIVYATYYALTSRSGLIVAVDSMGRDVAYLGDPQRARQDVDLSGASGSIFLDGDDIYYAHPFPYLIERITATGQDVVAAIERTGFRDPTAPESSGGMMLGGELPASISYLHRAVDGRFFVNATFDDGRSEIDVLSASGTVFTTVALPVWHRLGAVNGDTLYTYVHGDQQEPAAVHAWILRTAR